MATITQKPVGFQLRVTSKHLPKTFYQTFDTREQAEAYGKQLEALLAQGIVPAALMERTCCCRRIFDPGCRISWPHQQSLQSVVRPQSQDQLLGSVKIGNLGQKSIGANMKEAEHTGGPTLRDGIVAAYMRSVRGNGEASVRDTLAKGEKVEVCDRWTKLVDSGAFDINSSSPMFDEVTALVKYFE